MLKNCIQYFHFAFKINEIIINVTKKLNPYSNLKSIENETPSFTFFAKNIVNVL